MICSEYKVKNFHINGIFRTFHFFQDKDLIVPILSSSENSHIQKNLNTLHGHLLSADDYESSDKKWENLHIGLKKSLTTSQDQLKTIMAKHLPTLYKSPQTFVVKERLDEYLTLVWAEYCYGSSVDHNRYRECKKLIFNKSYYPSNFCQLPLIGGLYIRWIYHKNRHHYRKMKADLLSLFNSSIASHNGLVNNLFENSSPDPLEAIAVTIVDSFSLFLAVDHVNQVLLDFLLKSNTRHHSEIEIRLESSLRNQFPYPLRFRRTNRDCFVMGVRKGDVVVCNLKESELYFSSGLRNCPGEELFRHGFIDFFEDVVLKHKSLKLDSHHFGEWITKSMNP